MTHAEIERQLRRQLDAVVMRLGHAVSLSSSDATTERALMAGDLVEDAQLVEAQESAQLGHERLARQARSLALALQRLQAGTYGVCAECGGGIGAERLRALPSATRCVACQEQFEDLRGQP